MSSKPYVALAASLVSEVDIPHAGAKQLDQFEYEALITGLQLMGPTQCRSIINDPKQAHLFEAALEKVRNALATPAAE